MASLTRPTPGLSVEQRRSGPRFDGYLLLSALILLTVGLMSVYSEGVARDGGANFRRQLLNTVIGIGPFALFYSVNPKTWLRGSNLLYGLMGLILLGTLFLGKDTKGAQRWIEVGPLQFQPSEMAKLLAVLTLATFYGNRQESIQRFSTFALGFAHMAVPLALILMQPHLGAALVMLVVWFSVSLLAGVPMRYFGAAAAAAVVLVGLVFTVPSLSNKLLHGYQKDRIEGLLTKSKDTKGSNWQTDRAEIAFGVGGVYGTGFLQGQQKAGQFIPEQRNDFVFTVIGEEGGLIGCTLVLAAYGFFFYRIFLVMLNATDPFYKMVVGGIFAVIGFHTFVNIAMVLQILPVVGLWLPFLSSGGTAIWLCMACVGLLLNIRRREKPLLF
jgi:rod shape determining protein RodA